MPNLATVALTAIGWWRTVSGRIWDRGPRRLLVSDLSSSSYVQRAYHDGEKFPGGYGPTKLLDVDYWTLRARSAALFKQNLYARGLIRRLITNEINVGLHLEAKPEEGILGIERNGLEPWAENVENRFSLWAGRASLCDHTERRNFGALQATARREALINGDVLVTLIQDEETQLPRVKLISGSAVQSPVFHQREGLPRGHRIVHGVELDAHDRHVAYWIQRRVPGSSYMLESTRVPAYGSRGRRNAWLVYGTDKRLDDVRGEPLLSLVMQSVQEIDRYRDSTQRKAVLNSMLAMFIRKGEEKAGTRPLGAGAIRREKVIESGPQGKPERVFNTAELIPGLVLDELEHGEEPSAFPSHGTDERFSDFEKAIIGAVAWANEIPPEILMLGFGSNYSASQAAINEYKTYLNRVRTLFASQFCEPIYEEWLIAESLTQKISAQGLIQAWRDRTRYDVFAAWVRSEWAGQIKPAVDLSRLVRGYREMVAEGFITRDRASRELTGTKFSKNAAQLEVENEMLAKARESVIEQDRRPTRRASALAIADDPVTHPDTIDREPVDDEEAA
jgi:lambda family phage portal protein